MLTPGQRIELSIEKPAAGGTMLARHDGQVVLVGGAVPGERVVARVDRAERTLAFATTIEVREPSPDRRQGFADSLCGGCVYSHIAYPRQLRLKAEIIHDAFARIGRVSIDSAIPVEPSPERGHRMRARFHAERGRIGFFREGTHTICDALPTGQLSEAAVAAAVDVGAAIERSGARARSLELSENIPGDQRALSIELEPGSAMTGAALQRISDAAGFRGCVARDDRGLLLAAGEPRVVDSLDSLTRTRVAAGELGRHPESFFQANRYLLPSLVLAVIESVPPEGDVLDLYAGVGLFSVALAGAGFRGITAVEGDRASGKDLERNAGPFAGAVRLVLDSVERFLDHRGVQRVTTAIVDPPRTGMSAHATTALARLGARQIVYVSCDPPTMARDARRLVDAGYRLSALRAFDLFPNTPHVEAVGVFLQEK
jgi:23S rRNA (uracil1939-C5)-methyltransferase